MLQKMFKKPEILDKNLHKNTKISPMTNYAHAKKVNFIPIGKEEAAEAMKYYPIFFIKDNENFMPIAILGLKEEENLFLQKNSEWQKEYYIPALIRCYPFALAATNEAELFSMTIDAEYEGLNKKDGQELLDDSGELTEYGKNAVGFVEAVYADIERTKTLTNIINELGLFLQVDANVEANGAKYVLQGIWQVDANKLNELDDEKMLRLAKTGALHIIFAHSASASNFRNLAAKIS